MYPGSNIIQDQGSLGSQQPRSSEIHVGDFIPMQTIASSGPTVALEFGFTSGIPASNQSGGNTFNTSYNANRGLVQEPGINQAMARELQKFKDMISSVPRVVKPIPEIPDGSHKVSRFAPPICNAEIPKRVQTPNMKLYNGTTDPKEHVAQYRERMEINPVPERLKEACLCKGFGSTLTGSALKWLLSLLPYSITSFSNLVNLLNSQFSCSRRFERLTRDLYRVTQGHNESLRDYITKFSRESLEIPNLDIATAVEAFKMGLLKDSQFYDDLNLGDKSRWPRKSDKPAAIKDKSKWCAYHEDFGHLTDECIALRNEIGYLMSKGYLKELFGRKKSRIQDSEEVPEKAPPPVDAQIIHFISVALISVDPHHDGLVITLSSVNIIQLDVLKRMNIPESDIVPRSSVLVGFSGEMKNTLGDIKLPIYIEGAMDTRYESNPLNISSVCETPYSMGCGEDRK
ncbi:uncharacterized protein LOC118491541 [Helianthus annuus]|uniref:uncharacterized protein LOC118491541 n=1 Tax=Helianthus annuus TaxID=4232 RepID=UPI001652D7E8|nr:uncharacterized protein LOC118491541 [Helianthus annuus]